MYRFKSVLVSGLLAGAFLLPTFAGATAVPPPSPTIVVVNPANMHGWYFFDDLNNAVLTDTIDHGFVTGPGTPPIGVGSVHLTKTTTDRYGIATTQFAGTPLSSITALSFSTYRASGTAAQVPSLGFDVDAGTGVSGYQGRLTYEPYFTQTVNTDQWQTWNTQDNATSGGNGNWWFSHAASSPANGKIVTTCTQSTPCTWAQVLAAFPNAKMANGGQFILRTNGADNEVFDGNVDNLTIATSSATTFDFEPAGPVTVTIDKFVDGSMATAQNANSSAFPMQSSWNASNIDAGSGTYNLDTSDSYEAITAPMTVGATYTTNEDTSGTTVGAACSENKPFALNGYSTSSVSMADAISKGPSADVPNFTNLQSNSFVVVWNTNCAPAHLTIVKHTVNGDGTFNFTLATTTQTGSTTPTVAPITTVGGSGTSSPIALESGSYNVTENVPSGWALSSHQCVYDNEALGQSIPNGEAIIVGAGDSVTCTFTNINKQDVHVSIIKYVDGTHATAANANNTTFPFTATYQASNLLGGNPGSDPFTIGPVGNGTSSAYEAKTVALANGANYSASENTSGNNVVSPTCGNGTPFALGGYTSGNTLTEAQGGAMSSTAPAFTNLAQDKFVIVWNNTCANLIKVHILKYLDYQKATASSANNYLFPMTSTWMTASLNGGATTSGMYVLGNNYGGATDLYGADTSPMQAPANYSTTETTHDTDATSKVLPTSAQCSPGMYRLLGYKSSNISFADAAGQATSTSASFNGLAVDKYVLVYNETCGSIPVSTPATACMLGVAPQGYTLRNGTPNNDKVTLQPKTMFVGNGGNDKITGPNGNYIICTGAGNDTISLGNGDDYINAGDGNNIITIGNGSGTITTGSGNDTITTGNGARTINAGEGNNTIVTGNGDQTITTGAGNDKITTQNGADNINAGDGKNTVKSGAGNDTITTGSGNDVVDAGAGTDTCNLGGGNNTKTSCELP